MPRACKGLNGNSRSGSNASHDWLSLLPRRWSLWRPIRRTRELLVKVHPFANHSCLGDRVRNFSNGQRRTRLLQPKSPAFLLPRPKGHDRTKRLVQVSLNQVRHRTIRLGLYGDGNQERPPRYLMELQSRSSIRGTHDLRKEARRG